MKLGRIFTWTFVGVDLLVIAGGLYLAFWPVKSIVVRQPDHILNPTCAQADPKALHCIQAGDALVYQISYCKYIDKEAVITRTIIGAISYTLPASTNKVPIGCHTAISRNTIIPLGVEPGVYRLSLSVDYQINPLRTITITHLSEPFTVIARTGPTTQVIVQTTPGTTTTTTTSQAAPTASTTPFHTDPVTQEPTQPTHQPNLLQRALKLVGL